MKTPRSIRKIVTGSTLMFTGVLLMFVFVTLPVISETVFGNIANLIIGATLLVSGLGIFTNPITPKKQKEERTYQKSKHELIEIFGLK